MTELKLGENYPSAERSSYTCSRSFKVDHKYRNMTDFRSVQCKKHVKTSHDRSRSGNQRRSFSLIIIAAALWRLRRQQCWLRHDTSERRCLCHCCQDAFNLTNLKIFSARSHCNTLSVLNSMHLHYTASLANWTKLGYIDLMILIKGCRIVGLSEMLG